MIPLPEWAPNVHPMLVHFPIALLFVAVLFDAAAVTVRRWTHVRGIAVALYVLGALAALVTFLSGRAAADALLLLPAAAETTLTDHSVWATRTVWFYGAYALGRLALLWLESREWLSVRRVTDALVFVVGAIGLVAVVQTGDRGAMMVYRFGVGVQTALQTGLTEHDQATNPDSGTDHLGRRATDVATPDSNEMSMSIGNMNGAGALALTFRYLEGGPENLVFARQDSVLDLVTDSSSVFIVLPESHTSFLVGVEANTAQFDGQFQLAYHVRDEQSYDFVSISNGLVQQGRAEQGAITVFDEGTVSRSDTWRTVRVVSDGSHFRAYVDGQMRVHGHGPPPKPGPVGLRVTGTGTVQVRNLRIEDLR